MKTEQKFHTTIIIAIVLICTTCFAASLLAAFISYQLHKPTPITSKLSPLILSPQPTIIGVMYENRVFATASSTLEKDPQTSASPSPSPQTNPWFVWKTLSPSPTPSPTPTLNAWIDEAKTTAWIESLTPLIQKEPKNPAVIPPDKSGAQYQVFAGEMGVQVDILDTVKNIINTNYSSTNSAQLTARPVGVVLSTEALKNSEARVQRLATMSAVFIAKEHRLSLTPQQFASVFALPNGFSQSAIDTIALDWSKQISTPPTEPVLEIENNTVKQFTPPRDGIGIETTATAKTLRDVLEKMDAGNIVPEQTLEFTSLHPTKSLADTNSLGIEELIGRGDSKYAHSIAGRIHNVGLTTTHINYALIQPGEEFSFNKQLGDVSAQTGYKPAYIIKDGQTVLGDGGGVCQVSSTVFRAILNAGLPITERRGHSYRVGYYEQNSKPGFDATVYSPHPDLRFLNDTKSPILIYAQADSSNLSMYVEFWGKSDGRKAEITNYKQWDAVAAPAPRYQDDSTIPAGTTKQIDFAAPGLKTSFDYIVTYADGQVKTKTFQTNYIPWQAVYLRGI